MTIINIAKDFSSAPAGRFHEDGQFNGTAFRDEYLLPPLRRNEHVVVILDGVSGFGSSFLEEAFGGLIRVHHLSKSFLKEHLEIKYQEPALVFYAYSIQDFIEDACQE